MSTPIQDPAGTPGSTGQKRSPAAPILGLIAGVLLVIGSFLTWVVGSVDASRLESNIAGAMGVDPTMMAGTAGGNASYSVSGVQDGGDGVITLVLGLVVVVLAVVVFSRAGRARAVGTIMLLAGLISSATALYDLSRVADVKDEAITAAASGMEALGLDRSVFDGVFKMSAGIGLYLCALGGVLAVIAGILVLARKAAPAASIGETMAARPDVPGVSPDALP